MAHNSSSSPTSNSSSSSFHHFCYKCLYSKEGSLIFTAFTITNILLLLPLLTFVLYLGFQRWRRQRRVSAATTTSHSDIFTYHMVAVELICFLACGLFCCGIYTHIHIMVTVGLHMFSIVTPGQLLFHCLTCIERYLAVVHPIIYLSLRKAGGIRLRNISIGFVWLLCFGWVGVVFLYTPEFPTLPFFSILVVFLVVTAFCSLSVLFILVRPKPGEAGGKKERVDQSKQRAFHTIMAITGTLVVRFVGFLVCFVMSGSGWLGTEDECVLLLSAFWFSLPSSLVLPLLFLHRAGKLVCCKTNAESD